MPVRDISKTTYTATYPVPEDLASGQRKLRVRWEVSLYKPSDNDPQPAYFRVKGATWIQGQHCLESAGCLHDLLVSLATRGLLNERDAIVPSLLRWHMFNVKYGPSQYIANSLFWYKKYLRHIKVLPPPVDWWWDSKDEPEALDHFKSTIVFGALDNDTLPAVPEMPHEPDSNDPYNEPKVVRQRHRNWVRQCEIAVDAAITPWLKERLPRLMPVFEADMVRWFGPKILAS